ncbi:alpha/beta hydrolase fold domain-containing protein [Nocardia huaxiensis]|nr:alpha/beta hydrolase fold domain-containing protein [Nocardia huaxiensis]
MAGKQAGIVLALLAALMLTAAPGAAQPEPAVEVRSFETLCTPEELVGITGLATVGGTVYATVTTAAGVRIAEVNLPDCGVRRWLDLPDATADTEAVAGRTPGGSPHLWLADGGVNRRADAVTLTRLNTRTGVSAAYRLPLGADLAERHVSAVLVESTGRPVVVTTESSGRTVLFAPRGHPSLDTLTEDLTLWPIGEVDLSTRGASPFAEVVLGGAVNAEGTVAALRTAEFLYLFPMSGANAADAVTAAPPIPIPIPAEISGEAVTFTADGDLLLGSFALDGRAAPLLVFRDATEFAAPLPYFEPGWSQRLSELLGVWAIELAPFWFILGSFVFAFFLAGITGLAFLTSRPAPTGFSKSFQDMGLPVLPVTRHRGVARLFALATETRGEASTVTVRWFGPASLSMRLTHALFAATVRPSLNVAVALANLLHVPKPLLAIGTRLEWAARLIPTPLGTHRRGVEFERFRAEWVWHALCPDPGTHDSVIVWFHGGAFVSCGLNTHRRLVAKIARSAEAPVLNVAYRQLPRAHLIDAVEDGLTAYRHLLDRGFAPERILLAGDSTGAGLAFAVALTSRDVGLPVPGGGIIALSPWADYDSGARLAHLNNGRDPALSAQALAVPVRWGFAPDGAVDPRWSPVNHDFTTLPPVLIQVGSTEVLLADVEQLARRCDEAHVQCTVQIWDRCVHVFPACSDVLPEARYAIGAIGAFAQRALRPAPPEEAELGELSAAP